MGQLSHNTLCVKITLNTNGEMAQQIRAFTGLVLLMYRILS